MRALPKAFWTELALALEPDCELTPALREAIARDLWFVERGDVELVRETLRITRQVVTAGLRRVRRIRAAAVALRDELAADGSEPLDVSGVALTVPAIEFLERQAAAITQLCAALNGVLFGIGGSARRDLDALVSMCDGVLDAFAEYERDGHRRGARSDSVREWLVHQTARHLQERGLEPNPSDGGVLARATEVLLAQADRMEGVPVKQRKKGRKRHLERWLRSYQPLRIPNSVPVN